jgi:myosin heavy subunit
LKKSILKIAVPTLALGIAFAPMASAAPNEVVQKTEISVKTDSKTKEAVKKLTAKEIEAIKKLSSITKNLTKVEVSVTQLSTATTNFYAKAATTPISTKVEADFYSSMSGKLKANSNQLKALKKQVDHVAKKYKNTDAVAAGYKKIADLNKAISLASKNLTDLHNQFKATAKVDDAKKLFAAINTHISNAEINVAELSKATVEFYAKAATDTTVTSQVEAAFYTSTSGKLKANTRQLQVLKKQLDLVAKYNDSVAVAATDKKIAELNNAITVANKNLSDLHAQFKAKVIAEETKMQFNAINIQISKVETNVAELSKASVDFYAKATTDPKVTSHVEANFYASTASKLNANSYQLKVLKQQLDYVAKSYTDTIAIAASNKKIADLNIAISVANKSLSDLHTNFKAALKAEEGKKHLIPITNNITKVEASIAELTKSTVEFYAKATTNSSVTIQVEADFYAKTSAALLSHTKQLISLNQQLDSFVKNYGSSADVTAAIIKINAQNKAIVLAVDALINFHTNFKPVAPATTNS